MSHHYPNTASNPIAQITILGILVAPPDATGLITEEFFTIAVSPIPYILSSGCAGFQFTFPPE
jgi:hypothetical protein